MGLVSKRGEEQERGDISIAGLDGLDGKPADSVYELDEWDDRGRALLRERLETLGVPHTWEDGTTLVISEVDDAWVERIMDQVEDDLSLSLDPDVTQIVYDLTGWDAANRDSLFDLLEDEAVPYGMDGDDLHVHEIDEQRVDELIDTILEPDAEPAAEGDGGGDVMGDLFVAVDRLARDPADHEGKMSLHDVVERGRSAPVPYGMDKVWWDSVVGQAGQLQALVDSPTPDDEAVVTAAAGLREGLRPYV